MQEATSSGQRRWVLLMAIGVVAVVVGAVAVLAVRDGGEGGGGGSGSSAGEPVPRDVLSGPGTELADGLVVAEGSSLIGPLVVTGVEGDAVASWFAVVLVEGEPEGVWQDYAGQLAERFPDAGIEASDMPGCFEASDDGDRGQVCHLTAHDDERDVSLSLHSPPGDVTGRYLLRLDGEVAEPPFYDGEISTGPEDLPEPQPARERPGVGGPLAPVTAAYEDDADEYVVVEGAELLAQYGVGSITGGFEVLLRVRPDANLDAVVEAYIRQADQYDDVGMVEETPPPDVTEHDGTTVSQYFPPGGAGGYSGEVTVVDRPEGDDYVYFELLND